MAADITAWAAAQRWHDEAGHKDDPRNGSCFCCCPACDPDWGGKNPHYTAAEVENPPADERPTP